MQTLVQEVLPEKICGSRPIIEMRKMPSKIKSLGLSAAWTCPAEHYDLVEVIGEGSYG